MARRRKAVAALLLVSFPLAVSQKKKRKKRSVWVKEWLKKRDELSMFFNLYGELRDYDPFEFKKYIRMDSQTLEVRTFTLDFSA
jgi:hypothetical protein